MLNPPLFSVVIPVYNRERFITSTIQSVIAQKFTDWELIVVDDGSTDSTSERINGFSDNRIRYIRQDNAERAAARNTGVREAKGTYIMFLDSDDMMLPDHMTQANLIIKKNNDIPLFHLNFETRSENRKSKITKFPPLLNREFIRGNAIGCAGIVLLRTIAVENPFREDRMLAGTEDYELWLRLSALMPFLHFPPVTFVLNDHDSRSVANQHPAELEKRIQYFIRLVSNNDSVRKFIGKDYPVFLSLRYSYIALHAAMSGYKKTAWTYWMKSLRTSPASAFSFRFLQIIRFILAA